MKTLFIYDQVLSISISKQGENCWLLSRYRKYRRISKLIHTRSVLHVLKYEWLINWYGILSIGNEISEFSFEISTYRTVPQIFPWYFMWQREGWRAERRIVFRLVFAYRSASIQISILRTVRRQTTIRAVSNPSFLTVILFLHVVLPHSLIFVSFFFSYFTIFYLDLWIDFLSTHLPIFALMEQ